MVDTEAVTVTRAALASVPGLSSLRSATNEDMW